MKWTTIAYHTYDVPEGEHENGTNGWVSQNLRQKAYRESDEPDQQYRGYISQPA